MDRVRKFFRRSPAERRLLLAAVAGYVAVSVLLRCMSFARLRRWGARLSTVGVADRADAVHEPMVIWAVSTAAVLVPIRDNCLAEALTAHWLLAREGQASVVRIGITPAADRPFAAHAWLESHGRAVLGAPDPSRYVALD